MGPPGSAIDISRLLCSHRQLWEQYDGATCKLCKTNLSIDDCDDSRAEPHACLEAAMPILLHDNRPQHRHQEEHGGVEVSPPFKRVPSSNERNEQTGKQQGKITQVAPHYIIFSSFILFILFFILFYINYFIYYIIFLNSMPVILYDIILYHLLLYITPTTSTPNNNKNSLVHIRTYVHRPTRRERETNTHIPRLFLLLLGVLFVGCLLGDN